MGTLHFSHTARSFLSPRRRFLIIKSNLKNLTGLTALAARAADTEIHTNGKSSICANPANASLVQKLRATSLRTQKDHPCFGPSVVWHSGSGIGGGSHPRMRSGTGWWCPERTGRGGCLGVPGTAEDGAGEEPPSPMLCPLWLSMPWITCAFSLQP